MLGESVGVEPRAVLFSVKVVLLHRSLCERTSKMKGCSCDSGSTLNPLCQTGRPSVCFSQPSSQAPGLCVFSRGSSLGPNPVSALSLTKLSHCPQGRGLLSLLSAVSPAPRMAWLSKVSESDFMILRRRLQVSLCS